MSRCLLQRVSFPGREHISVPAANAVLGGSDCCGAGPVFSSKRDTSESALQMAKNGVNHPVKRLLAVLIFSCPSRARAAQRASSFSSKMPSAVVRWLRLCLASASQGRRCLGVQARLQRQSGAFGCFSLGLVWTRGGKPESPCAAVPGPPANRGTVSVQKSQCKW